MAENIIIAKNSLPSYVLENVATDVQALSDQYGHDAVEEINKGAATGHMVGYGEVDLGYPRDDFKALTESLLRSPNHTPVSTVFTLLGYLAARHSEEATQHFEGGTV